MFNRPGWQASMSIGFIVAGFVMIGLAWRGSANVDFAQGQIPYLLSGGFFGLGLIVVGVGLMLFESGRRAGTKVDRRISELSESISKITVSSNGAAPQAKQATLSQAGKVVIGASSYHRPDCRLVEGKDAMVFATRELAENQGLAACRVCNPDDATIRS